jgi:hypothetical protein
MVTEQAPHEFKKLNGKVYWGARVIKGADYDSFQPLSRIWARDKRHIYANTALIGADPATFKVGPEDQLHGFDKNQKYDRHNMA